MEKYIKYRSVALLLCLILLLPNFTFLSALKVTAAKATGTVTATSLNVRSGPGTTYSKVQVNGSDVFVKQNQTVTILEEKNDWYHIQTTFNGKTVKGYVKDEFVKLDKKKEEPTKAPTKAPTPTPTKAPDKPASTGVEEDFKTEGEVTATSLNVRKEASTTSGIAGKLKNKEKVTVLKEIDTNTGKWYYISFKADKKTAYGYVLSDYIKLTLSKTIKANVNSEASVKIRTTASDKGKYLTNDKGKTIALKHNKSITIRKEVTDAKGVKWFYISFTVSEVSYRGYIQASQVVIRKTLNLEPTNTPTPSPTVTPEPTATPEPTPTPEPTSTPTNTPTPTDTPTPTATPTPTPVPLIYSPTDAVIANNTTNIYSDMNQGLLYDLMSNTPLVLNKNHKVTIHSTLNQGDIYYYFVGLNVNYIDYYGYVLVDSIKIGASDTQNTPTPTLTPTITPTPPGTIISSEEFEAHLIREGFPESYKPYLRDLHNKYPHWIFEAYHTGLDWNTVIQNESKVGINLITNSKGIEWKSLETSAYNWKTDKFIPYDGSTWVTVSKEGLEYYMDPRNFLDDQSIFQFELLRYKSEYQNAVGVEGILYNTALYNKTFSYCDAYGQDVTTTYGETFIKAAEYSGVSPYHLASRVKQEVVTGPYTLSNSVSGTVSGYEGLYNFYNIGAFHSTVAGGAVINGLKYAKNGTTSAANNQLYLIPWNNPYNSIVGGSYILGSNYINRGQDTIYLQKFNVTSRSTYSHQYMANVEAPWAEGRKVHAAYTQMMNVPIVFSIPVYYNMPYTNAPVPQKQYNPNNWLKTLSIDGYSLTPTFGLAKDQIYTLIVDEDTDSITISATSVSTKATIIGTGEIPLNTGLNEVKITVIAENSDIREYIIYVTRE